MATERLVLDASFALEAILPTSAAWQSEAFDLFDRIASQDVEARVPLLFFAEVAAVVTRKVRGRRLDDAEAAEFLLQLDALGLHIDLSLDGALQLYTQARQWQAGAYDAIYLATAKGMDIPIATRDGGMIAAARAAGVTVYGAG